MVTESKKTFEEIGSNKPGINGFKLKFEHVREYEPLKLSWEEAKILRNILFEENSIEEFAEDVLKKIGNKTQLKTYGGKTIAKLFDNGIFAGKGVAICHDNNKNDRDPYNREIGRLNATYYLYQNIKKSVYEDSKGYKDFKDRNEMKDRNEKYLSEIKEFILNSSIKNIEWIFFKYFDPKRMWKWEYFTVQKTQHG